MRLPTFFQLKPVIAPSPEVLQAILQPPHKHEWVQQLVSYAPPRRDAPQLQTVPEIQAKAVLGLTSILYQCSICHETKTEEMLGNQNIQLDELLDKAEQYGTQYLQRNGITFLIQRYMQQTGGLPLR